VTAADQVLRAVVLRSGHVPLGKRAQPLVAVLSGAIATGDELDIACRDGVTRRARVHGVPGGRITPSDPDSLVALDGMSPDAVGPGDPVGRPGDVAPPLSTAGPAGAARAVLLHAAQWARGRGFGGPAAELLARLPDDAVVLFVERRLRAALGRHANPHAMLDAFQDAAAALEAIGLAEDADRLRLTAAAALEGHMVAPTVRALAKAAAVGSLEVADAVDAVSGGVETAGSLLGLDVGEGFAVGFQGGYTVMGEQVRTSLLAAGRAVSLGWCGRCRDVAVLDQRLRCVADGKRAHDVVTVVPADVEITRAALRARRR